MSPRYKAIKAKSRTQLIRMLDMGLRLAMGSSLRSRNEAQNYGISGRTFARDMDILSGIMPIVREEDGRNGAFWSIVDRAEERRERQKKAAKLAFGKLAEVRG